jgi:hypothetical protein
MSDINTQQPSSKRTAPTSRASSAYPRKRAVVACQVCRARRTKCDQKRPVCSFCESVGAECLTDPAQLSTFDPASLVIIERLDSLERKFHFLTASSHPPQPVPIPLERQLADQSHRSFKNTSPVKASKFISENLDAVLKWPIFQDSIAFTKPRPARRDSYIRSPASQGSVQTPSPMFRDELQPAPCTKWLDTFFSQVHIKNPILNEQNVRRTVRKVCLDGIGWDAESCLTLLVCANGALARPLSELSMSSEELNLSSANALFISAQKRLGPVLASAGVVQA